MQGWRISMEDSHTTVLDLIPSPTDDEAKTHTGKLSFFGVFDGHGGDKVALFAGENIYKILQKQDSFKKGEYNQGLKDSFLATDRAILNGTLLAQQDAERQIFCTRSMNGGTSLLRCIPQLTHVANRTDPKYEDEVSGCTACVSLIAGNKVYVVRLRRAVIFVSKKLVLIHHADIGKCGRLKRCSWY